MDKQEVIRNYQKVFAGEPHALFFSPGRINVIGEHTDYNGGHAFPAAISLGVYGAFGKRADQKVALYSADIEGQPVVFDLNDETIETGKNAWTNYLKGMLVYLSRDFPKEIDYGFNLYLQSTLPTGAGLSSSAALEMLMGIILKEEFTLPVERIRLAELGQKTENEFIGLNSGIMDQFACIMGKKDNAMLLNCNSLDYQYKPLELGDYTIVIISSNQKHVLADSAYNERIQECQRALQKLQKRLTIDSLGQLDSEQFEEYSYLINDDLLIRRARHAVTENERTIKAANAMEENDLAKLGRLLNASHISLHYDYQVTSKELDLLVATAWKQKGVLGARMIGGGFGGSAIAIVKQDCVPAFIDHVGQTYRESVGYDASFYHAKIVDGAKKI